MVFPCSCPRGSPFQHSPVLNKIIHVLWLVHAREGYSSSLAREQFVELFCSCFLCLPPSLLKVRLATETLIGLTESCFPRITECSNHVAHTPHARNVLVRACTLLGVAIRLSPPPPRRQRYRIHKHTMPKRQADSTQDENPPKRRQLSADEVLVEAAKKSDTTAVRAVLEKLPQDSETVVFDAVYEACRGNHDECLALLLPHVETTQVGFGILLSECVHANHVACTEVLLQHWKSVCKNEEFVPHVSEHRVGEADIPCPAMWSDPAVCRVLIDAGADIETKDERGRSPLHRACNYGALKIVKMLVEAGAGVRVTDNNGRTCLTLAAYSFATFFGHTETVRYLVGLPEVDVNHRDADNHTVLHYMSAEGDADVVQVLIDAGADIEMKNCDGRSPLHCACTSGVLDVVKKLVRAGAGVRDTDNNGDTCLTLAAYFGHTETVHYLVGLPEVDVNHRDGDNDTALHYAVEQNHTDIVQLLIAAGADMDTENTDGRSP